MAKIKQKLFPDKIVRHILHAFNLTKKRQRLRLTVEQFATIVGWSVSYQYKLESAVVHSISETIFNELKEAFRRIEQGSVATFAEIKTGYIIGEEIHYIVHPEKIYTARKAKGLWLEECAARCGWSLQYQQNLEDGKVKTVAEDAAKILRRTLE